MGSRIMCFGDSLTWGWIPAACGVPTERYPWSARWPGVLAGALGPDVVVIEEGLSGRTTDVDDPTDPRANGAAYLPSALASHLPLDLVIVMLGSIDTKALFHRTPFDIGVGVGTLLNQIAASAGGVGTVYPAPRALLVAPPPLGDISDPWFELLFAGGREKSTAFADVYRRLAGFLGVAFFDAGSVITTDGVDGIHFTAQNNRDLGVALAEEVRALL